LSRETPMVTPTMNTKDTAARTMRFLRLALALDGRGISICLYLRCTCRASFLFQKPSEIVVAATLHGSSLSGIAVSMSTCGHLKNRHDHSRGVVLKLLSRLPQTALHDLIQHCQARLIAAGQCVLQQCFFA
jgi:hypothetical protein